MGQVVDLQPNQQYHMNEQSGSGSNWNGTTSKNITANQGSDERHHSQVSHYQQSSTRAFGKDETTPKVATHSSVIPSDDDDDETTAKRCCVRSEAAAKREVPFQKSGAEISNHPVELGKKALSLPGNPDHQANLLPNIVMRLREEEVTINRNEQSGSSSNWNGTTSKNITASQGSDERYHSQVSHYQQSSTRAFGKDETTPKVATYSSVIPSYDNDETTAKRCCVRSKATIKREVSFQKSGAEISNHPVELGKEALSLPGNPDHQANLVSSQYLGETSPMDFHHSASVPSLPMDQLRISEIMPNLLSNIKRRHGITTETRKYIRKAMLKKPTYVILINANPKRVHIGGKVEMEVVLSLGIANKDGTYQLKVPQDKVLGSELNVLLTAPHFYIHGENANSLSLDLAAMQNMDANTSSSQTMRFSLTALRSGPMKIQLDLYVGDTFETSLEDTVQVTRIEQANVSTSHVSSQKFGADPLVNPVQKRHDQISAAKLPLNIEMIPLHDLIRPRPVRHPNLILQVRNMADVDSAVHTFHYHLISSRAIMRVPEQGLEYRSGEFPAGWLERVYALLRHTLESTIGAQAEDRRIRLVLLGQYLFRSLLPDELQRTLKSLVKIGQTLLILSDQDAVLPWTLLHDGQAFLSEHFIIGRWLRELHDTCPYEFPVGVVSIAYYDGITRPKQWAELLAPVGAPLPVLLPGGLLDHLDATETMRGLHLLRAGKSSRATDLRDAPALLAKTPAGSSIEQQVQVAKFSLRSNHPLVTLSYLHAGLSEITALEQSWSSTFIRAGCSAFIGPLWAVQLSVEEEFVRTFYDRLWAGDALGEAFSVAREQTRKVVPNSIDYLAYVLFGDPLARPYRPVKGDGYATIESVGREMEDPVSPGTSARFRVSLRRRPPIWHEGRVIEVAEALNYEHLKIYVLTFDLDVTPATPISLVRSSAGDYFGWFNLTIPSDTQRTTSLVQVHFVNTPDQGKEGLNEFDAPPPIHSLRFTLPIAGGDGDAR